MIKMNELGKKTEKKEMMLTIIDGNPPQKVKLIKESPVQSCLDDKHCAKHGSDPYFCCKCGAEFEAL